MKRVCEYDSLCRKMEMREQSPVSYWPRDSRLLKSYCNADKDPKKCSVHNYLEGNPELRDYIKRKGGPYRIFLRFSNFLNGLKRRKDRPGTHEIYQKILTMLDSSEEMEARSEDMFGLADIAEDLVNKISNVDRPTVTISEARGAQWRGTSFKLGKLNVSYPLTYKFDIISESDVGIVLSYEYTQSIYAESESGETKCYATGVLGPVIRGKGVMKNGITFIDFMMYRSVPVRVPGKDGGKMDIVPQPVGPFLGLNRIGSFFGTQEIFEWAAENAWMGEKTKADARNIHNLMQQVLYSDF